MARRLSVAEKLGYGIGQSAEGLKYGAFETILFFYYNQVLGLPGVLAGAATMIALVCDALIDPIIASTSDNMKSSLGRRHPFLYLAIVPVMIFFILLFNPPAGLEEYGLFLWLLFMTIGVRACMSCFTIPYMALGAELTNDYDERTSVTLYRGIANTVSMAAAVPVGFALFFHSTDAFPNGQLNPAAYPAFGVSFAAAIGIAMLIASVSTQHRARRWAPPKDLPRANPIARAFADVLLSMRNYSFRWFFIGALAFSVARGAQGAFVVLMYTYFWMITPAQIAALGTAALCGGLVGPPFWAFASRWLGKRDTYLVGHSMWALSLGLPPLLFLAGAFPAHGSPWLVTALIVSMFMGSFSWGSHVTGGSMIADVADEHELTTGRRQEGMFFGAISFSGQASSGFGLLLGGIMLDLIGATPGGASLAPEVRERLGLVYGPVLIGFGLLSVWCISHYRLTRERLYMIQTELAERRQTGVDMPEPALGAGRVASDIA